MVQIRAARVVVWGFGCLVAVSIAAAMALRASESDADNEPAVQTRILHLEKLESEAKGKRSLYRVPDISGMSLAEFVRSEAFSSLQWHGVRVILETDESYGKDEKSPAHWVIKDCSRQVQAGDIVVVRIIGPSIRN